MRLISCAIAVVAVVLLASAFAAEAADKPTLFVPKASSSTAMRNCGAELEAVKVSIGATRQYIFTGAERLRKMWLCKNGQPVVDMKTTYYVEAGTVGSISSDGKAAVFPGCVNQTACEGCPPEPPPTVLPPPPLPKKAMTEPDGTCPGGWLLVGNAWSLTAMPQDLREKALALIRTADARDGMNPATYRPDDVSRTMGARLRRDVQTRAPIVADLRVAYWDSQTGRTAQDLGALRLIDGMGAITFPDDPRERVIEIIWPGGFRSPTRSGEKLERVMRLFGPEWGSKCSINIHGLVE